MKLTISLIALIFAASCGKISKIEKGGLTEENANGFSYVAYLGKDKKIKEKKENFGVAGTEYSNIYLRTYQHKPEQEMTVRFLTSKEYFEARMIVKNVKLPLAKGFTGMICEKSSADCSLESLTYSEREQQDALGNSLNTEVFATSEKDLSSKAIKFCKVSLVFEKNPTWRKIDECKNSQGELIAKEDCDGEVLGVASYNAEQGKTRVQLTCNDGIQFVLNAAVGVGK